MNKSDMELVVASVPWRTEGLNGVLNTAREQGIKHVALILDRYTEEAEAKVDFSGFDSLRIKRLSKANIYVGNGYRYFLVCTSSFPVTMIVDDDMELGEGYFDQNLQALQEEKADCISWAGATKNGDWISIWDELEKSVELFSTQAANVIFRTESVRAFLRDKRFRNRWHRHYCVNSIHDEILLSCWLYMNNKRIIRPARSLRASFIKRLDEDPRSLRMTQEQERTAIREELADEMGWYTTKGSWSDPKTRLRSYWLGGPLQRPRKQRNRNWLLVKPRDKVVS